MLRRRIQDEKVNVRKAALQAMENLIRLDKTHVNAQVVRQSVCQSIDQSINLIIYQSVTM